MPLTITGFAPKDRSSDEITKTLAELDPQKVHYKLEYFDVSAVGGVPRDILAFGKADWEDLAPTNWPAEVKAPFGYFPVLHIYPEGAQSPAEDSIRICESFVVEHFLAEKFNLLGKNAWEAQQIKMFHSSSAYVRERVAMRVTWNFKEVMDKGMDVFMTGQLPLWIETHSKYLKDNGSNGHYIGDQLSLADLQTANTLDHLEVIKDGDKVLDLVRKTGPLLWKVKETVDREPRLQAWRQSEGYKAHVAMSVMRYASTGI